MASLESRARGLLWGIFIPDALSMPVHWFYDVGAIRRMFGRITDFHPAPAEHPSSIMSVANTAKGGRGDQRGDIIGRVILHDKRSFWGGRGVHYHNGMKAGENTLNSLCARVLIRTITEANGLYDPDRFLQNYVTFMTTPGTHNDTYAESYHRDFFSNFDKGLPPRDCAGAEGHDTPSVGGLVSTPVVVLAALAQLKREGKDVTSLNDVDAESVVQSALTHLRLTHRSAKLEQYTRVYVSVLVAVLGRGLPLDRAIDEIASPALRINFGSLVAGAANDSDVVGGRFSIACYIDDSLPSLLFLGRKYHSSFEDAVVANTNCGGENCHRGSALGALVGAANGVEGIPERFRSGLAETSAIQAEIDALLGALGLL